MSGGTEMGKEGFRAAIITVFKVAITRFTKTSQNKFTIQKSRPRPERRTLFVSVLLNEG